MTIEDLARQSGLKVSTVERELNKVKGIERDGKKYIIPEGSRFPYKRGNLKLDNQGKRQYAFLKATSSYRYIDHEMLDMPKNSFDAMIQDLLKAGLIVCNGSSNTWGGNKYDTTLSYENLKKDNVKKRVDAFVKGIELVVKMISLAASSFGAVVTPV